MPSCSESKITDSEKFYIIQKQKRHFCIKQQHLFFTVFRKRSGTATFSSLLFNSNIDLFQTCSPIEIEPNR